MQQEVIWFGKRMQEVLDMNKYKEGDDKQDHWSNMSQEFLYERLVEEVDELRELLDHRCECCGTEFEVTVPNVPMLVKECCDIANFAMMLADNAFQKRSKEKPELFGRGGHSDGDSPPPEGH